MKKILFNIGGYNIYSYGLMIAIGVILGVYIFSKRASKDGKYDSDKLLNLAIITLICGFLGSKLLFIIVEFKSIMNDPSILLDFGNGFVVYGGIILGAIGLILYCRVKKWDVLEILDYAAPSVALAQAFGRIGCFLAGCCYGAETDFPISVEFPLDSLAPAGVHLHPTQLYSAGFDFALAIFLLLYSQYKKHIGNVVSMYAIVYSVGRFLVEFLRDDPRGSIGGLTTSQFISIITLILGIILFVMCRRKGRSESVEKK